MRRKLQSALTWIAVGAIVALTVFTDARAGEVPWRKEKFAYVTNGQSLRDFLRQFASSQGLTVVVDPMVEGSVVGSFMMTPQSTMEFLGTTFGLIWYYDGNVLYVYPTNMAASQVVRLNYGTIAQLRTMLGKLDVTDKRYPIAFDTRANTALVSGPKRYVELVEQTARALDQNEGSRGSSDIQIFPLKYAWAADYTYMQTGREYKLPGIATVLRNLYQSGSASARQSSAVNLRRDGGALDKLRGSLGLPAASGVSAANLRQAQESTEVGANAEATSSSLGLPQFQSDGRLNAVLVRDSPDRMAFYERVIRQLDIRPAIVEIEARIIEVNSDVAESLGVDWRLQTGRFDVQSNPSAAVPGQLGPQGQPPGFLTPDTVLGRQPNAPVALGGLFATRLMDSGRELLARVNALAKTGQANVLSSPRVMTLDNVEATLENMNTFFVRVAGNLDVDLFNVSAGTSLRVTPLIVPEGNQTLIKLAVKIEDGNVTEQRVDAIPVVRRTNIGTQAFIVDGESLLIAGFAQTSDSSTQAGVPGLSQVPVFGRLFRFDETRKQRVERLFMLTPRVIPLPVAPQ
jgi:type III secretion protein C